MPPLTAANDLVRARNVSASEVGALMDKHPYASPLSIYLRLTQDGPVERIAQSEAMALGSHFEPLIASYAAQTMGLKLRANTRTLEHRSVSLCATPDYYVLGKPWLVECKLSNKLYQWTDATLQSYVEWQARAQMAVTNREAVIIAALVGSTFHRVTVMRDMDKERRMLEAVDTFFHAHVLEHVPPPEVAPQERLRFATVEG